MQGQSLVPDLYRDQALYLQLMRGGLLSAVRQALFLLITDKDQNRLNALSSKSQKAFQEKVEQLVSRCCSLLTVEQLMDLVRQMERERQRKRTQARRELMLALSPESQQSNDEAEGSIHLSLSPPLEHPELLEGLFAAEQTQVIGSVQESDSNQAKVAKDGVDLDSAAAELADQEDINQEDINQEDINQEDINQEDINQDLLGQIAFGGVDDRLLVGSEEIGEDDSASMQVQKGDLEVLRSLFVMAGETMSLEDSPEAQADDWSEDLGQLLNSGGSSEQGLLPASPLALSRWMDAIELALFRRLRNLSHALNVELLRAGIVNSLLPTTLLDAVLRGQVESLPAQSNLLKLRLPVQIPTSMSTSMVDEGMEIVSVLLRQSELEFDNPRLRQCRSKLRQHRRALLKMVRQQRHWQRRAMAEEAEKQWWQNPPTSSNPPKL
ncbi:MAG: Uncharacterised protein [Prochlorococcus marinus str. MIT 9215]|nr:MAG: Uncharacterised protein [Prochlorococcus marinus str. MIT 9215]